MPCSGTSGDPGCKTGEGNCGDRGCSGRGKTRRNGRRLAKAQRHTGLLRRPMISITSFCRSISSAMSSFSRSRVATRVRSTNSICGGFGAHSEVCCLVLDVLELDSLNVQPIAPQDGPIMNTGPDPTWKRSSVQYRGHLSTLKYPY
jgi:hypothetical protein